MQKSVKLMLWLELHAMLRSTDMKNQTTEIVDIFGRRKKKRHPLLFDSILLFLISRV